MKTLEACTIFASCSSSLLCTKASGRRSSRPMACGAAVIGSNTTSLPEVIGREDATFDPKDVDAMANAMVKGLTDTDSGIP